MHGATYTVDAAFFTDDIDDHGLVVDIGLAMEALAETLAPLRYKNLDEMPEFEAQVHHHGVSLRAYLSRARRAGPGRQAQRWRASETSANHAPRKPRGPRLVRRRRLIHGLQRRLAGTSRTR
jgi:hypothetical protein